MTTYVTALFKPNSLLCTASFAGCLLSPCVVSFSAVVVRAVNSIFLRTASTFRTETDSSGPIDVPYNHYLGAQTQRSISNFDIRWSPDRMPTPVIHAFDMGKMATGDVNLELGLDPKISNAIQEAAYDVASGSLD